MSRLIRQYRKVQSELRDLYDPFTAAQCPTCPTPCCMKPVRVDAIDIALAEADGCRLPAHSDPDGERVDVAVACLTGETATLDALTRPDTPCDFLGQSGFSFPRELRPFGCTRFICDPMKRMMDPSILRAIQERFRRLDYLHSRIVAIASFACPTGAPTGDRRLAFH